MSDLDGQILSYTSGHSGIPGPLQSIVFSKSITNLKNSGVIRSIQVKSNHKEGEVYNFDMYDYMHTQNKIHASKEYRIFSPKMC